MINALNTQIAYLSQHSSRFTFPKILYFMNIMSWTLAVCCVGLVVAVLFFGRSEVKPYAVTQTGVVASIKPIDAQVMQKLLEKSKQAPPR